MQLVGSRRVLPVARRAGQTLSSVSASASAPASAPASARLWAPIARGASSSTSLTEAMKRSVASQCIRTVSSAGSLQQEALAAALGDLSEKGYTIARMGASASVKDMEAVAQKLMGVDPSSLGTYNGKGGVSRKNIEDTSFVDAAAGAPSELKIQFHNEMAYATDFPKFVTFAMVKQATLDGTTILADNVQVQKQMSPALVDKFRRLGVEYVRYLHSEAESDAPDFYMSWQKAFQTESLEEAMQKGNNPEVFSLLEQCEDGRRLRHTLWCPVFFDHPNHGETFFNSVLNRHGSWMDGHAYFDKVPNTERPYHCLWGDGTEFSEDELKEIRDVYEDCTEYIRLDCGDVLVVDNLRVVHGRTPYSGSRLLGLLLSDHVPRASCQPPSSFRKKLQSLGE